MLPVASMLLATLVGALLPLLRTHSFYFWDDTAAAAAGVWQRIARSVLSGEMPFLQLDMWRGGNFAAEAATGMWNPVMVGLMVAIYPIDDLAVAMAVARIVLFFIMAGGIYLLARVYGSSPWMAAAAGTALTLSGWVLYLDGTAWINGTAAVALIPWAWWGLRKARLSGFTPAAILIAVVTGYLVASTGNPYALLALAVAYLGVAIEAVAARRYVEVAWLVATGLSTLLLVVVVYLPFVLTSKYGVRAISRVWNDEFLAVSASDLLGLSSPTFHPYITMFGSSPMGLPGAYLAWFVLPLVPWLRWGVVRERLSDLAGVITYGLVFLLLTLGPSQVWLFRWPARLIPILYIAVIVLFAIVASAGLCDDRKRSRSLASGALILLGAWLAFSDVTGAWKWHALVALLIAVGVALLVFWAGIGGRGFLVMAVGMVAALVPQLALAAVNLNVANYQLPTSKDALQARFARYSDGLVVDVYSVDQLMRDTPAATRWNDLLVGNMPSVAGVSSVNSYTGIGFTKFDDALCITYNGGTCPEAWDGLWQTPAKADRPLADLLRVQHVVVANGYAKAGPVPDGWRESRRTELVTAYERIGPIQNPDGTVSATGKGVTLVGDSRVGSTGEIATVSTGQTDTRITFARIAWPGYTLSVGGTTVHTQVGPAGLLTADLPPGLNDAELRLTFSPPGLSVGLVCAGAGLALLIGLMVLSGFAARKTARSSLGPAESDAVDSGPGPSLLEPAPKG